MGSIPSPVIDFITLQFHQAYSHVQFPAGLVTKEPEIAADLYGMLHAQLVGHVLTEAAGPRTVQGRTFDRKVKPKWIPGWVWKRIPTESAEFAVTVEPKYTYPHATIRVPELGKPVRIAVTSGLYEPRWERDR